MMTLLGYKYGYDNVAGNMWLGKLYFDLILAKIILPTLVNVGGQLVPQVF